ncbi:MAG: glycosyltransferase family 4 protein [Kofleriaceae bacterium]
MRIGVVTTSFPRHPGDPAGHFVGAHVEHLRAEGHAVDVVAAGDAEPRRHARGAGAPEAQAQERTVTRVPSRLFYRGGAPEALAAATLGAGAAAGLAIAARLAAATARRARGWDATCAHWLVPAALAAPLTRGPLLAVAHGGDVHVLRRAHLLTPVLLTLLARGTRLVFVTAELAALARAAVPPALRARFDAAALVRPMGVDVARLAAARDHTARPQPRRYALVLARLAPIKGVELAVRALSHVRAPVELVIAGDGPERGALERLARASGRAVRFLGEVSTLERDRWLAHADAVLVPSRRLDDGRGEGLPQAAIEALAAGVPLLASAAGGLAELAAPARVLPLEERDPRAWASALDELLAAPPARGALRALAATHDWPRVAAALRAHWRLPRSEPR